VSALKPRKEPTQPRARETVAVMLEAAAQVLEAAGRAAFNTNAVAERAGVSIGSLYQYFPGKDALLLALMKREKQRFREDAEASLAHPDGRAALEHLVAAAVRQQLDRPELARLLDIEEERPELQDEANASSCRPVLRRLLDRDDLPMLPDRERATDDLMSLIQALVDGAGLRGDRDAEGLARRVLGTVLGYLQGAANVSNTGSKDDVRP
jgi:AcrR family transcriptional regulator